ncbi:MAG: hypothetical protein AAF938_10190 [Myxococcota bacterium]
METAHHYCIISVKGGKLEGFQYIYSVLWGTQDSPAHRLASTLIERSQRVLGKPKRKTKKRTTFEWAQGTSYQTIGLDVAGIEHADVVYCTASGKRPGPAGADDPDQTLRKPDAASIKDAIDGGCDSYDCRLSVEHVEVAGDAPPYTVTVQITYLNQLLDKMVDQELSIEYSDPAYDLVGAAFERIDELIVG